MKIELNGRTAIVTGGSKGLGFAVARQMAQSGAAVAILARGAEGLEAAVAGLREAASQARVIAVQCDVRSAADISRAHQEVVARLGPVDILVNNAGGHAAGRASELSDAQWEADLEVKLLAQVRFTREVWPAMVARRWGRVINVLNTLAKAPPEGSAPTSVTRAAQLALTKVLSQEGAPHNVLVNALLVGLIRADSTERAWRESGGGRDFETFVQGLLDKWRVPMGRIGEAVEFGRVATFLASDAASYVTGSAISVDGGSCPVI